MIVAEGAENAARLRAADKALQWGRNLIVAEGKMTPKYPP